MDTYAQLADILSVDELKSFTTEAERMRGAVAMREYLHLLPTLGNKRAEQRAIAESLAAVERRIQRRINYARTRDGIEHKSHTNYDADIAASIMAAFDTAPNIGEARRAVVHRIERAEVEQELRGIYRRDIVAAILRHYDATGGGSAGRALVDDFNNRHSDFEYYAFDDRDIIRLAESTADRCAEVACEHQRHRRRRRFAPAPRASLADILHSVADSIGVDHATTIDGDTSVLFAKYTDPLWWRPRLRRIIRRQREEIAIECGLVGKSTSHHSSRLGQAERKEQLDRNTKWSLQAVASDGEGNSVPMHELIKSKETGYQAELVTMMRGLSDMQDAERWDACMITVTCPGQFRRDGVTPLESADHLRQVWAKSRAKAKREGLDVRGCQVWQPHKDATAHEHIFAIGNRDHLTRFAEIIRDYALDLYPDETGAQERRCDALWEDRSKGRLSSYAARYVTRYAAKDGDTCATDKMTSEDTWYAAHGIRRVSWFGLPPKALWRRFRDATRDQCRNRRLRRIRKAARAGKYAAFCKALGWTGRRSDLDYEMLTEQTINKHGEDRVRYIGIRYMSAYITNTGKRWTISVVRTVIPNDPREGKNASDAAFDAMVAAAKAADPVPIPF